MANNINRVLIIGNLTRDPELRHTPAGTAVCDLSIAINSREKIGEEWQDRADFFDVVVWGQQAENCAQYLTKGSPAAVDGRLRQDRWEDRDSGQKRSKVKVVADFVQFLNAGGRGGGRPGDEVYDAAAQRDPYAEQTTTTDDDIPF